MNVKKSYINQQVLEIEGSDGYLMYKGKNITLRPFEKSDIEKYRQWVNNSEIALLVDRVLPVSETEHEKWYISLQNNPNAVVFAIEVNNSTNYIGNVWLWNIDFRHEKAEIRIIIGEKDYTAKGLGSEAIDMITRFAFEKINLHKVYAYVISSNLRAKRAFEKAGFTEEGLLRQDRFINDKYEDVFLMARIKSR